MMTVGVKVWWECLSAIGVFNVVAWTLSAAALHNRRGGLALPVYRIRRVQMGLSAIYVLGCAFRCFFPVYDVPRIGLVDHWLSSVAVGRSVATVAELCFVAQLAVLLYEACCALDSRIGRITARAAVPLIAIAESCSWYSVLTTSNIGHVAEESLWGITVALLVASMLTLVPRSSPQRRPVILGWCLAGSAYVAFMFCVDVPMYWARWIADEAVGRHYMTLSQGLLDVATRRVVSFRWADWKNEVVWMSLYFSVAVWISISLMHAPAPAPLKSKAMRRFNAVSAVGA